VSCCHALRIKFPVSVNQSWHRVDVKMRIDWFGSDPRMSKFIRPERRELNKQERLLLEWLIANGNADARQYASQIAGISVVGTCTCGCPTIDLATVDSEQQKTAPSVAEQKPFIPNLGHEKSYRTSRKRFSSVWRAVFFPPRRCSSHRTVVLSQSI
jgi:hypothetical protein